MSTCLVTGGAGFIGCAVSTLLADRFDRVVALDSLHPEVHARAERPGALDDRVELVVGDVTSAADWDVLLGRHRPDVVLHLAAETGTAVSLTQASRHARVNVLGTTQMLDAFVRHDALPRTVALSSSRAVYGEGAWSDGHALLYPGQRSHEQLAQGVWQPDGLVPVQHASAKVHPSPTSVYGATKLAQENVLDVWGAALGVTTITLRLQNVYGPGQSLTNPYTGIVSLFARVARSGEPIPVYEDGQIVRDFVFIDDVAVALVRAVEHGHRPASPYDIGSGTPTTVATLAGIVAAHYGAPAPQTTGKFRDGDVRYAVADPTAAREALGWMPTVTLEEGVARLCGWIDAEQR